MRIVAATNRNLEKEVAEGRFREDLYYRLKVFPVRVPPLRERREDIPLLAGHFLARYSTELGKPAAGFSQQAMELLQGYDWPGNVRELQNEVQRLVIQIEPGGFVTPDLLSPRIRQVEGVHRARPKPTKGTLKEMMDQLERWLLIEALREHENNKTACAQGARASRARGCTRSCARSGCRLLEDERGPAHARVVRRGREARPGSGIDGVGRDVEEREEREGALQQARVRDGQRGGRHDDAVAPQDVEVDRPRQPALVGAPDAPAALLDREQHREDLLRRSGRPHADGGVQVVGLRRADGRGLVDGRAGGELERASQLLDGRAQGGQAVAEVRAQPDDEIQRLLG